MLITALLGVASSIVTEVVTLLDSKLSGTVLQGDAALLLSIFFALIAGFVRLLMVGVPLHDFWSWTNFTAIVAQTFAFSQLYFQTLAKWFRLQVKPLAPEVPSPLA